MENKIPEHWLTDLQISVLKHHAMAQMVETVLFENPNACLFGGAVRDMILEAYQFGSKHEPCMKEYDKTKTVFSNDLDFLVRSEPDFKKLRDFFETYYHVKCWESEYLEMDFSVYRASVPLIVGTMVNNKFCIFVDLVYRKQEQRVDFDVNTMMYNRLKGFFIKGLPTESHLDTLFRVSKIVRHIHKNIAYFSKTSEESKWQRKRQERGLSLMERGWTLCVDEDTTFDLLEQSAMLLQEKKCHFCLKPSEIVSEKIALCRHCWLNYNVNQERLFLDSDK